MSLRQAQQTNPDGDIVDHLITIFAERGGEHYGEGVSQTEHALQSAIHVDQQNCSDALVCAALLHDVGHLLHEEDIYHAEQGIDAIHQDVGANFLEEYFGPEVSEPVRMHVDAKRYLCAVEPGYFVVLSEASGLSLKLQGGVMGEDEVKDFESSPHLEAALLLRRADEAAKVPGLKTPGFETFADRLRGLLKRA